MNFKGLVKRGDKMDKAFEELQLDMAEAFDESLSEPEPRPKDDSVSEETFAAESFAAETFAAETFAAEEEKPEETLPAVTQPEPVDVVEQSPEPARRLTSHTQTRLAALNSFEEIYHYAQEHLEEIDTKLSEVTASYHLTREFISILHGDIYRANELELANVQLMAEQRKLGDHLHDAIRKQQERETAVESLQRRETSLMQDKEALRSALAAAKLELVEAANTIARNEGELGDLVKTLSAKTVEAERRSRENELLREKHINLSIDLEKTLKREAETRRKLDEISTIHANEAARHSELVSALAKSEQEAMRLQKTLEIAQMKQSEMLEGARMMEADREAELARNLAEMRGLRSEIQSLQSRLEFAVNETSEASNEIAKLKAQLSDALAERHVADERLSALLKESETDKMNLMAANANLSQLSLRQASEQIQLDFHIQECEDLRAEIASLNARIKELLPYERLHRVTQARQHDTGLGGTDLAVVDATPPEGRRATASGRRRGVTPAPA